MRSPRCSAVSVEVTAVFVARIVDADDVFERGGAAVMEIRSGPPDFAQRRRVPCFIRFPASAIAEVVQPAIG